MVASILNAAEAQGANWIGNQTLLGGDFNTNGNVNEFAHELAHAIAGCAAGAAGASASGGISGGQGCGAGALGAVVGELSAQFYGDTDPSKAVAFAQMMSGIAAAATGLDSEGVAIAANTGGNAAQNNYMAHYDTYEKDLKACQKNPGGVNCGAILSLTEGTNARYLGMTQGGYRVAANVGKQGATSYTVVSTSGDVMVMEPREWGVFTQMSPEMQSALFGQSQWALDFSSYVDYAMIGDNGKALSNYGHMFTTGSYWQDMGLNLGLGMVGSRAFTAKMLGPRVVPVNAERSFTFNAIENPGPLASLPGKPAANFFGGKYNQSVLTEDLVLYRGGEAGKPLGQWFTREAPDSVAQVRIDSAVKPQWVDPKTGVLTGSSKIDTVYAVKIPKGTTIYDGPVGYQGGVHLGGSSTNQVFVPTPWNIKGVQVLGETPIK